VRPFYTFAAAGLLASCWLTVARADGLTLKSGAAETCSGDYGTSVHFVKTPSEAAKQALKEEKLVCVLHVSGLFENPDFT
jgi:hypothetical protein